MHRSLPVCPRIRLIPSCLVLATLGLMLVGSASAAKAAPQILGTLVLPAGTLALTTPDPPNVTVTPCDALNGIVLSPHHPEPVAATVVEVIVRNASNNPVEGASVIAQFTAGNVICPDATLSGTTDANGRTEIVMAGGGCLYDLPLAALIKANGVTIRAYDNVRSPDTDGNLVVDLGDLILFATEFGGTSNELCHDYNDDGETELGDLVIFAEAFVPRNHCP